MCWSLITAEHLNKGWRWSQITWCVSVILQDEVVTESDFKQLISFVKLLLFYRYCRNKPASLMWTTLKSYTESADLNSIWINGSQNDPYPQHNLKQDENFYFATFGSSGCFYPDFPQCTCCFLFSGALCHIYQTEKDGDEFLIFKCRFIMWIRFRQTGRLKISLLFVSLLLRCVVFVSLMFCVQASISCKG